MRKFFLHAGLVISGVIAGQIASQGAPFTFKWISERLNAPLRIASPPANKLINSIDEGHGWELREDDVAIVNKSSGMELKLQRKDENDKGTLSVRYTISKLAPPKFPGPHDADLIREAFDRFCLNVSQKMLDAHLNSLASAPVKVPVAAPTVPTSTPATPATPTSGVPKVERKTDTVPLVEELAPPSVVPNK